MTPKVYGITGSPPFRAVLMCAKELGIELDVEMVDMLNRAHLKEDFIKKNPQHTVPLLDDDGFLLADSHAINGYLVGAYGKPNDPLYPKDDIKRRAKIDNRLHLDTGILAARGLLISKPLIFDNVKPTQFALDLLKDGFSILDKQLELQNTHYIVDDRLSIADFSITATVTSWGFFVPNWEKLFPNINAYIKRMEPEVWFEDLASLTAFNNFVTTKLKQFEK